MRCYPRPRPLPLEQQLAALRALWPTGKAVLTPQQLTWTGPLTPTAMSRTYLVRLTLPRQAGPVIVEVLSPDLRALAGPKPIPHLYCQRRLHLCLYTPAKSQWNRTMSVAHTLLPWALLWLYYFEDWLPDRVWRGGGTPHGQPALLQATPTHPGNTARLRRLRHRLAHGR